MKSRFNHNHLLDSRYSPAQRASRDTTHRPTPAAKPCLPGITQPRDPEPDDGAQTPATNPDLVLEDEIPLSELNDFALSCIELLTLAKKDQPAEQVISSTIAEKLPSYTSLKAELLSSRQHHRSHHVWTRQMYNAVEPLLKQESAPLAAQQNLSELAIQCVEHNLQLQYRVEQLGLRVSFLENTVPGHLVQIGREIGLPEDLLIRLGKLVKGLMERHC